MTVPIIVGIQLQESDKATRCMVYTKR